MMMLHLCLFPVMNNYLLRPAAQLHIQRVPPHPSQEESRTLAAGFLKGSWETTEWTALSFIGY